MTINLGGGKDNISAQNRRGKEKKGSSNFDARRETQLLWTETDFRGQALNGRKSGI